MLLPYTTITYYGPAAGASVITSAGALASDIQGYAQPDATLAGVGTIIDADATRLKNSPATITASATITQALPKGRARPTATIKVNELSQDDVTGAVLEATIEGGLSLKEVLRVLLAVAAGKTDITGSVVTFRDTADTKDRVVANMTGSERTTVTIDAT